MKTGGFLIVGLWLAATCGGLWADSWTPPKGSYNQVAAKLRKLGSSKPAWWDSVTVDSASWPKSHWAHPNPGSTYEHVRRLMRDPNRYRELIRILNAAHGRFTGQGDRCEIRQLTGHGYLYLLRDFPRAYVHLEAAQKALPSVRGHKSYGRVMGGLITDRIVLFADMGRPDLARPILSRLRFRPPHGYVQAVRFNGLVRNTTKTGALARSALATNVNSGVKARVLYELGLARVRGGDSAGALKALQSVLDMTEQARGLDRTKALCRREKYLIETGNKIAFAQLKDGTYQGSVKGFSAQVTVAVTVADGRVTDVKVTGQRESRPYCALSVIPAAIVEKQSISVDAVTGATVTADAVREAAAKALEKAQ